MLEKMFHLKENNTTVRREVVGGIDDTERMALRDEALKGTLIEYVNESFALYHLVELGSKCQTVGWR